MWGKIYWKRKTNKQTNRQTKTNNTSTPTTTTFQISLDLHQRIVLHRHVCEQSRVALKQTQPIRLHVLHTQMVEDEVMAALCDALGNVIVVLGKSQQLFCVRQILFHGNVVNPRLHFRIVKLEPLFPHVKHQRIAQKQMLVAETGGDPTKVKQIRKFAMIIQLDFLCGRHAQCVCIRFPGLVLGVLCISQLGISPGQQNQRVALAAGAGTTEKSLLLLLFPGPLACTSCQQLAFDVPAAQPRRLNGHHSRSAGPEGPCWVHDVLELRGAAERPQRHWWFQIGADVGWVANVNHKLCVVQVLDSFGDEVFDALAACLKEAAGLPVQLVVDDLVKHTVRFGLFNLRFGDSLCKRLQGSRKHSLIAVVPTVVMGGHGSIDGCSQ
eukprot:m.120612 g.120612  ORF g.120612 m.120612 type:complete len:381 (-) comp19592_c0_seq2:449-1591(-)